MPGATTHCAFITCICSFPDHRWGAIRAFNEGWFVEKNGTAWCPDHVPEWVADWRARRARLAQVATALAVESDPTGPDGGSV